MLIYEKNERDEVAKDQFVNSDKRKLIDNNK